MDILRYERKRQSHRPTRRIYEDPAKYDRDILLALYNELDGPGREAFMSYVYRFEGNPQEVPRNTGKKKNIFRRGWDSLRGRNRDTP